ncbi:MAG TPA: threonine synthase [Phycisphaerales bacterium]|nr:threonine synthase [Phycisphaerales bacterium]
MKYVSTQGGITPIAFQDAVMMGLADDGGLIVPESIPDARPHLNEWRKLAYNDLAMEVMRPFIDDIDPDDLREMIDRAYGKNFHPEVAPTVRVGGLFVLELWHGPTLAFKDVALQLLGHLFEYILAQRGGRMNILGATSGDTGSAAICGVRGRKGIDIFVMHPHGRVSPIQERQMTTVLDANVHNLAVKGTFDDCQNIMKALAGDLEFKRRHSLGAVNSVNWARVLAQVVYYFKAVFDVQRLTGAPGVRVAVPTGNFGDILAGWYAQQMGLPISQLVLATNRNDILSRFFNTGVYATGEVHQTYSPSMDIQVASNFERYLYYRLGCDAAKLRAMMEGFRRTGSLTVEAGEKGVDPRMPAGMAGEDECLAVIREYHDRHGYLLDPHTAVGVAVAQKRGLAGDPVVCLATAHPAKFPDAIRKATGKDLAHHPDIDKLMHLPTRCQVVPNDRQAVREFIEKTVGRRS